MDTPLIINIDTGVITFRNEENAQHCNCRPISRKHAEMISRGELEVGPLLAAIKKHMMSAEDFDYDKYTDERRKLNVRHSALHADERAPVEDAKPEEYVTDVEIAAEKKADDPVAAAVSETKKRPYNRKPVEATLPIDEDFK